MRRDLAALYFAALLLFTITMIVYSKVLLKEEDAPSVQVGNTTAIQPCTSIRARYNGVCFTEEGQEDCCIEDFGNCMRQLEELDESLNVEEYKDEWVNRLLEQSCDTDDGGIDCCNNGHKFSCWVLFNSHSTKPVKDRLIIWRRN